MPATHPRFQINQQSPWYEVFVVRLQWAPGEVQLQWFKWTSTRGVSPRHAATPLPPILRCPHAPGRRRHPSCLFLVWHTLPRFHLGSPRAPCTAASRTQSRLARGRQQRAIVVSSLAALRGLSVRTLVATLPHLQCDDLPRHGTWLWPCTVPQPQPQVRPKRRAAATDFTSVSTAETQKTTLALSTARRMVGTVLCTLI